jgi:hypothetical protein
MYCVHVTNREQYPKVLYRTRVIYNFSHFSTQLFTEGATFFFHATICGAASLDVAVRVWQPIKRRKVMAKTREALFGICMLDNYHMLSFVLVPMFESLAGKESLDYAALVF